MYARITQSVGTCVIDWCRELLWPVQSTFLGVVPNPTSLDHAFVSHVVVAAVRIPFFGGAGCLPSSIHRTFGDFRPQIRLQTFSGSVLKLREDACHV